MSGVRGPEYHPFALMRAGSTFIFFHPQSEIISWNPGPGAGFTFAWRTEIMRRT